MFNYENASMTVFQLDLAITRGCLPAESAPNTEAWCFSRAWKALRYDPFLLSIVPGVFSPPTLQPSNSLPTTQRCTIPRRCIALVRVTLVSKTLAAGNASLFIQSLRMSAAGQSHLIRLFVSPNSFKYFCLATRT